MSEKCKCECKDCQKRYVGCHAECESYIRYAKWREEQNKTNYDRRRIYAMLNFGKGGK